MSKEANELLLELLACRADAAGVHCAAPEDPPPEPDPLPYEPDDKDGKKVGFF